ncbi:hypothetical protein Tsubulata_048709 [Turnera subulata]|uniref:Uncharacterized protein n=1 Tax=Turnera subulata TaxID=218843 RepID=A0A9Q0G1Q2_9ROSI|nr:hypothetical protein Tsubulata_048709 [Turnera subulata]
MGESSNSSRQVVNQLPNTTYEQLVYDALGPSGFGAEYADNVDGVENIEPEDGEFVQFFETLNAAHRPLYPNCSTFSELSLSVQLMALKSDYNLPQGCIDRICDVIKRVTPEGDYVPGNDEEMNDDSENGSSAYETGEDDGMDSEED